MDLNDRSIDLHFGTWPNMMRNAWSLCIVWSWSSPIAITIIVDHRSSSILFFFKVTALFINRFLLVFKSTLVPKMLFDLIAAGLDSGFDVCYWAHDCLSTAHIYIYIYITTWDISPSEFHCHGIHGSLDWTIDSPHFIQFNSIQLNVLPLVYLVNLIHKHKIPIRKVLNRQAENGKKKKKTPTTKYIEINLNAYNQIKISNICSIMTVIKMLLVLNLKCLSSVDLSLSFSFVSSLFAFVALLESLSRRKQSSKGKNNQANKPNNLLAVLDRNRLLNHDDVADDDDSNDGGDHDSKTLNILHTFPF